MSFQFKSESVGAPPYVFSKRTPKFQVIDLHIIMFQKQYVLKQPKMMRLDNDFEQNQGFCQSEGKHYLNNLQYEEDPIELFLNQDAFCCRSQQIKESQSSCQFSNTREPFASRNTQEIKETHQNAKKKSIFHNFQKHLITLIKKFINLSQNEANNADQHNLASQLWTAFMKTRSFNKKILHMVFGVLINNKIEQEFASLCDQFPEFRIIYSNFSISDIVQAQHVIRQKFVEHAAHLKKAQLQADCNVSRFEQFYEYYQSFIREVKAGPMTKRMTKSRKFGVVERLEQKVASQ